MILSILGKVLTSHLDFLIYNLVHEMSGKLFAILRLPFKSERTLVKAALPASDQYVFRIRKKEANRERLKLYLLEPPCGGGSNEHPQSII